MSTEASPWYREGLQFTCTRCGACCTGAPGYGGVSDTEIARLAEFCDEPIEEFMRKYVRKVGSRLSLIEKPGGDCIFWDKAAGCTVYPARPVQCQTWPFWSENIESPAAWSHVKRVCPGSGKGQWFSLEEIEAAAARISS
jgi:uncharacterized protein